MVGDCIRIAWRNLIRHGIRTLLTMIGIIIGTCSVVAVYSIGIGGREAVTETFQSLGLNGMAVTTASTSAIFRNADIQELRQTVPEISAVTPLLYQGATLRAAGADRAIAALGVGDALLSLSRSSAVYGRGFSRADTEISANVCMLDASLARALYGRENIVGQTVRLSLAGQTGEFQVIGVIGEDAPVVSLFGAYLSEMVYIPYTTHMNLSSSDGFPAFILSFAEGENAEALEKRVLTFLEQKQISNVIYQDLSSNSGDIRSAIDLVTLIISCIAAISLVVGGIGVMTIMLVAVNERKKEIGMKKALGATGADILSEFICEALMISLAGGGIGILLGYLLSQLSGPLLGLPPVFDFWIALYALIFCAVIGILFSVYPAKKAANLAPIDCLKYE